MRRQVLSILVENTSGVLSRVSGLFSRRGYNVDSITAGVTTDPRYTRMTIVTSGDELILEQIEKQLAKLEDVIDIKQLRDGESVCRELILVKVHAGEEDRVDREYFPRKGCRCKPGFHGDRTDRRSGKAGCFFGADGRL